MNRNSRIAIWLQEHFSFFQPEPLFGNLLGFLEGTMRETVLSALSTDGSVSVMIVSNAGNLLYSRTKGKVGKCIIEQVEFVPRTGKGLSFTFVDNDLTVLRSNGSDPRYSPQISLTEQAELSAFMETLRQKTEEFLKTAHT